MSWTAADAADNKRKYVNMNDNIIPHAHNVSRAARIKIKGHQPAVLWFTGLSGSGKSTLANAVETELNRRGVHTYLLDGDNIRDGLNKDLAFSAKDRSENIRRVGEVTKLFYDAGLIVLTAFISPFREDRKRVRALFPEGSFLEIFVSCPVDLCEQRDPKGLYLKAHQGEIPEFTGLSSPYEAPQHAEIVLNADEQDVEACAAQVIHYLDAAGFIG